MSEHADRADNSFAAGCRRVTRASCKAVRESVAIVGNVRSLSFEVRLVAQLPSQVIERRDGPSPEFPCGYCRSPKDSIHLAGVP